MNALEIIDTRKRMEMTQSEFGKMLGKGLRTVQMWEKGERKMNETTEMLLKTKLMEYEQSAGLHLAKDDGSPYKIAPEALARLIRELFGDIAFRRELFKLIDDYMIAKDYVALQEKLDALVKEHKKGE